MQSENISLYYRDGGSDKVYHVQLVESTGGFSVNFQYGRRGSTLQTGTKTASPVEYAKAKKTFDKLVAEKTSKGYTPGADGVAYQGTANEARVTGLVPQLLNPIDASEVEHYLASAEYGMEEKMDGERRMVRIANKAVTGSNRKGLTVQLPAPLVDDLLLLAGDDDLVLDGEQIGDTYHVFDLLSLNNIDYTLRSVVARHRALSRQFAAYQGHDVCKLVPLYFTPDEKRAKFAAIKAARGEGVVFKQLTSEYTPGRPNSGGSQLKFKFTESATVLVVRGNDTKRSVAVACTDTEGNEIPLGNVTIPPNYEVPLPGSIVEVLYLYAYPNGSLYQPVYKGVRKDQGVEACTTRQLKYKAGTDDNEDA